MSANCIIYLMENKKKLGKKIQELRKQKGFTQEKLSEISPLFTIQQISNSNNKKHAAFTKLKRNFPCHKKNCAKVCATVLPPQEK